MPKPAQLTTPPATDDALKGAQLTAQYHRATGAMREVVIFGAMMLRLRSEHPETTKKGPAPKSSSTRGTTPEASTVTLRGWLAEHAPEVKLTTALRFLHVTEAVAQDYAQIVGPKLAKSIPLHQLVTSAPEDLPAPAAAKQLELFEWVNGTSQRSWLDRFSPESPQQRGASTRAASAKPAKPKVPTAEELAEQAKEEITGILNALDAFFLGLHHTRLDKPLRHTTEAVFEEAAKKLRAVK